jgi:S-DNA-T family DNA segregation ATPase FtsK/SpoIIIE
LTKARGSRRSARSSSEAGGASRRAWDFAGWLREHGDDAAALGLAIAALITLLGMLGLTQGSLVDAWIAALERWLGWFAAIVPLTMILGAIAFGRRRLGIPWEVPWLRVVALEIAFFALMGVLALAADYSLAESESGRGGGLIGWGVGSLVGGVLGRWGGAIVLLAITIGAAFVALRHLRADVRLPARRGDQAEAEEWLPEPEPLAALAAQISPANSRPAVSERPRKAAAPRPRAPSSRPASSGRGDRDRRLPPAELLDRVETRRATTKEIQQMSSAIERTLADFGIPARVVDHRSGPTVTQFAVEPGFIEQSGPEGVRRQKVRVSQISSLADDLALALSAPAIRVEAPVPGQAYVGIEVPHRRPGLVSLRAVMESEAFQRIGSPLAFALGRDVAGEAVAADLVGMPHLLIAGTTGSGKSVLMTALATCLLFNNTPADLQMVLIDPKMVELVRFNGVPHLIGKVETELNRIVVVLRWCTQEMDRRYRELEKEGARDLEAYNRKVRRRRDGRPLPRMVILIDELADLMMMAPDQTERTLIRLAQMGRATGIHLVVATQRPSTDIVTGLIKANFPARVSFAVPSMIDSRVILDGGGAETLLGKGDMLYLSPAAGSPVRLQGVYVSDTEVQRLVDYWKETSAPEEPAGEVEVPAEGEEAPWEDLMRRGQGTQDQDEVLDKAIALVRKSGYASASMLQRRLRLGYPRAARLMDELEELGVVGRSQGGGKTREVLIRDDEDDERDPQDEDA